MDKKAFGKQLQRYRERAGYSQEALAEQIECSTIFISYIERGEKSPAWTRWSNWQMPLISLLIFFLGKN